MTKEIWIFAYGSLIWRPGFDYSHRVKARLPGWSRRFWQASTDHRGVPGAPGRVVTLVDDDDGICEGVAYCLDGDVDQTLAYLDHREQGGYERRYIDIELLTEPATRVTALVYVGDETNPQFTGATQMAALVDTIRQAHGPSGSNRDYLLNLAEALEREGIQDSHVAAIAEQLSFLF